MLLGACSSDTTSGGFVDGEHDDCETDACSSSDPDSSDGGADADADHDASDGDGGDGDSDDEDEDGGDEVRLCDDGPATCCSEIEESLPEGRIEFSVFDGHELPHGSSNRNPSTASGVWEGLRRLDQPEELDCLDNAEDLGLPCEVDRVGFFKDEDKNEYELLVGLPLDLVDELPVDESVDLEERYSALRMVRRGTDEVLLAANYTFFNEDTYEFDGFELHAETPKDEADDAVCLTDPDDECRRIFSRVRLVVEADSRHVLEPGEMTEFTAEGKRYKIWHGVSEHRYRGPDYGHDNQCADLTASSLRFGLISVE
ncbi:MAG: hypothetical protein ACOCV2_15325 [Persicimonas sp.]